MTNPDINTDTAQALYNAIKTKYPQAHWISTLPSWIDIPIDTNEATEYYAVILIKQTQIRFFHPLPLQTTQNAQGIDHPIADPNLLTWITQQLTESQP